MLAASVAVLMALFVATAHAMTSAEAEALANATLLQKDPGALAKLQSAAQSGDANAQDWLGVMYANGQGVPQDDVIAYALFNVSATNDLSQSNDAASNRKAIASRMTEQQVAEGQELTRRIQRIGVLKAIDTMR